MGTYKKNNEYYIDYYLANRKRKREKIGKSKKLAERALQRRKTQVIEDKIFDIKKPDKIQLKELCEKFFILYCKPNKTSWKNDVAYLKHILEFFGNVYLNEITTSKIEEFRKSLLEKGAKHATVNRYLACLRSMLNKAVEWAHLQKTPMGSIKLFKEDNMQLRFLAKEEIERLLHACPPYIRSIVLFALNTGMRKKEILNLRWSNIDFENILIHVEKTKSKKPRIIPMNIIVKRLLVNIREHTSSEYIFCDKNGKKIKNIRRSFEKVLEEADIEECVFHTLRHTFSSHFIMSGGDIKTLQEILGHYSVNMTMRYSHLSQSHKAKAMEALGQRIDTIETPTLEAGGIEGLYITQPIDSK